MFSAFITQLLLFALGFTGVFYLKNLWMMGFFAAGLLLNGFFFFSIYRKEIRPADELIEHGRGLVKNKIGELTTAIAEVAQCNFAVQVKSEAETLSVGYGSDLWAFTEMLNEITAGLQNTSHEFNELTEEPCQRLCYVGTDSFLEGRICGEIMAHALNGRGMVSIATGQISSSSHETRRKGFLSILREKYPEIEVVDIQENNENPEIAFEQTLQVLKKNPQLAGIYVSDGATPPGVAKAVCKAKKTQRVKIVGHDLLNATMPYITDGVITATISQDPFAQGYDPIIHLFNHIVDGWQPPMPRLLTRMEVVDKDNCHLYWNPDKGLIQSEENEARLAIPVDKKPSKPLRFVYLGREETEFWVPLRDGVKAAAKKLIPYNVAVEWWTPPNASVDMDFSATVYGPQIESLMREKVDGIALYCGDPKLVTVINDAIDAGIPIITANSEPFNLRSRIFTVIKQAQKLMDVSYNLADNASKVSSSTSQISATLKMITDRAMAQNDEFQNSERGLESLMTNIKQIHWEAKRSADAAQDTVEAIEVSTGAMNKSLDSIRTIEKSTREIWNTVKELARYSERIDAVVRLIDDIASRVNVLALNAAIEATHAGEFGRGFMVVSNEIRSLAKNTTAASGDIAGMVGEIKKGMENVRGAMEKEMEKMQHSTAVTDEAKTALESITDILDNNRQRMQRIASSISEVQLSSNQVNETMKNVAQTSTKNTDSIREINGSAEALNVQFKEVADLAILLEKISHWQQDLLAKFTLAESKN